MTDPRIEELEARIAALEEYVGLKASRTGEQCEYIKHGKEWVLIPGCMGTAAMGVHRCTCPMPPRKRLAKVKRKTS